MFRLNEVSLSVATARELAKHFGELGGGNGWSEIRERIEIMAYPTLTSREMDTLADWTYDYLGMLDNRSPVFEGNAPLELLPLGLHSLS